MEEKKHIDRLYQEKFKDFEATPREVVWNRISSRLQQKQRRKKPVPVWYKMAGVAAVFALFISYANGLFKTNNNTGTSTAAKISGDGYGVLTLVSSSYSETMVSSSAALQQMIQHTRFLQQSEQRSGVVNEQSEESVTAIKETIKTTAIAASGKTATGKPDYTFSDYNQSLSLVNPSKENKPKKKFRDLPLPGEKTAAADIDEDKITGGGKLRVTTTAAPVYYDKMGNGSSIDALFANNETSGELTMSYGINFAYQISQKIRLRTGVNKVDLSYNTNNVSYTAAVNPMALSGVNYNGSIPNYRIENGGARPFSNISASAEFSPSSLVSPVTGYINQRLGFIEIPLEIEYVLIDKKIGVNLIGGGSTLFLDNNMISLNSHNFSTRLGEANNLNDISFSTNIGFGVDYKLSPQFELNLEPVFKYQLNTFNNTSGVNPYYFGVYSGFSLKF